MAKIYEEVLVIKVSKLVADKSSNNQDILRDDIVESIETVIQELVGNNIIVEVEKAK
jgi:hypothetical protein